MFLKEGWVTSLQDGVRLHLPLTNEELSQMVCVTREHLSRLLGDFDRRGVIRRDRSSLFIPSASPMLRENDHRFRSALGRPL